MIDNRIKALLDRVDELKEDAYEHPAPDYASYLERVGRYRGLKEAIQILENFDREEDDLD